MVPMFSPPKKSTSVNELYLNFLLFLFYKTAIVVSPSLDIFFLGKSRDVSKSMSGAFVKSCGMP